MCSARLDQKMGKHIFVSFQCALIPYLGEVRFCFRAVAVRFDQTRVPPLERTFNMIGDIGDLNTKKVCCCQSWGFQSSVAVSLVSWHS
jgi:hypothetical protein